MGGGRPLRNAKIKSWMKFETLFHMVTAHIRKFLGFIARWFKDTPGSGTMRARFGSRFRNFWLTGGRKETSESVPMHVYVYVLYIHGNNWKLALRKLLLLSWNFPRKRESSGARALKQNAIVWCRLWNVIKWCTYTYIHFAYIKNW